MRNLVLIPLFLLLGACAPLVKVTPAGDNVAVLQSNQVANCTPNGSTTVEVLDKVLFQRNPAKVERDLRTLARNRAAERGDTIVAAGPATNGEQTFNIYQCRR